MKTFGHWTRIPGTPDYSYQTLIAVYKNSYGGHNTYWIFPYKLSQSKRTQANALCVGGLPDLSLCVRLISKLG